MPANIPPQFLGILLVAWAAAVGGCGKQSKTEQGPAKAASSAATPATSGDQEPLRTKAGAGRRSSEKLRAGRMLKLPKGRLHAGSTPGDPGRDARVEPRSLEVDLGAFSMDALPYPNDPTRRPKTNVSRQEAEEACQEQGKRLCTELEWEYACRGPANDPFPTGKVWDPECALKPKKCTSGFGVHGLGLGVREWTGSNLSLPGRKKVWAVLRGGSAKVDAASHRCGRRGWRKHSSASESVGFRCCKGSPNAATVPPIASKGAVFRRKETPIERVLAALKQDPQLAPLLENPRYFPEKASIEGVLRRGDAGNDPGPRLTTTPVRWNVAGADIVLVVALRVDGGALIAALYELAKDQYRVGASLFLKGEKRSLVLSYTSFQKRRVSWSSCWGCQGEEGYVALRRHRDLVIVQKLACAPVWGCKADVRS